MSEKLGKSIPWLIIMTIFVMTVFGIWIVWQEVKASTIQPSVQVANSPPTVGTVTLDGGTVITVVGNNYTIVNGTTTVTDANGWNHISTTTALLYWSTSTATTCTSSVTNPNWCYYQGTCTIDSTTSNTINYTCSADVWFVAEPTAGTSSQLGSSWRMDIKAVDASNASDTGTTSQDLNTLYYLDFDSSIDYSTVALGGTSTEKSTNATNSGNAPIDLEFSGVDMAESGGHTISVVQQKYSSNSSMGNWQGTHLTDIGMYYDLALNKPTETTSNSTDILYWMMKIPSVQYSGTYTGTNTITACEDNQTFFCESASDYNSTTTIGGDIVYCGTTTTIWAPTAIPGGSVTQYTWGGVGTDEPTDSCIGINGRPACNYCEDLIYAGWADWELPSCTSGVADSNCLLYQFGVDNCGSGWSSCSPSWDSNAQASNYWSSTESDADYATMIRFGIGTAFNDNKANNRYVRCVRGQ